MLIESQLCENEFGQLETYDALQTNSLYDFFVAGPGHRCWLNNGYREWRQLFDDVRAHAQQNGIEDAVRRLAVEQEALAA